MKSFKLHHKIIAIALTVAFTLQSMPEISEHTYTTGIDTIHNHVVMSCFPSLIDSLHMSYDCNYSIF